jgi:hypothetical protein
MNNSNNDDMTPSRMSPAGNGLYDDVLHDDVSYNDVLYEMANLATMNFRTTKKDRMMNLKMFLSHPSTSNKSQL